MTIAETLFAVLMGAAICLCAISIVKERGSLAIAAGVLLGVAALTKPIAQVVVLAFLLGWFAKRKCRTTGLIFLLSFLACVAPWMIRNRQRHGLVTLSAIGIVELYFYVGEASSHPEFVTDFSGSALNHEVTHLSNEWEKAPHGTEGAISDCTELANRRLSKLRRLLTNMFWYWIYYRDRLSAKSSRSNGAGAACGSTPN
jgi:4-amino-4-deoxy-L-arabinose transferase-like glycosyltransferase